MGIWTLKYRRPDDMDFTEAQAAGAPGLPPFFDQITSDEFIELELFATHSDENDTTFYKPFNTRDWQQIKA